MRKWQFCRYQLTIVSNLGQDYVLTIESWYLENHPFLSMNVVGDSQGLLSSFIKCRYLSASLAKYSSCRKRKYQAVTRPRRNYHMSVCDNPIGPSQITLRTLLVHVLKKLSSTL